MRVGKVARFLERIQRRRASVRRVRGETEVRREETITDRLNKLELSERQMDRLKQSSLT